MLSLQPTKKFFLIVDVLNILEEYHLNSIVTSLFPHITPKRLISIAMALPKTPNRGEETTKVMEFIFKDKNCNEIDLLGLEIIIEDMAMVIDKKISESIGNHDYLAQIPNDVPYFWKWLNYHTLVLVSHNDSQINRQLQQESFGQLFRYLSEPDLY